MFTPHSCSKINYELLHAVQIKDTLTPLSYLFSPPEQASMELEGLQRRVRHDLVYNKLKKVKKLSKTGKQGRPNVLIYYNGGILLTNKKKVITKWRQYIEELYNNEGRPGKCH